MKTKIMLLVSFLILLILFSNGIEIQAEEGIKKESTFYLKVGIGGGGVEAIPLKMWTNKNEEVEVKTWVGGQFNFDIGYFILSNVGLELGIGRHKNGIDAQIKGGDGYFQRVPFSATGIYHFFVKDPLSQAFTIKLNAYGGVGVGYYMSPELYREGAGVKTTVNYDDAFGYHILVGSSFAIDKFFLFIDMKYAFGVKYQFKEAVQNGINYTTPLFDEWGEIDGSTLSFKLGVGYSF
ncbi:MAG: outer membrane beta-barrel protein [bacterium]|nr:outer membrane beta-barrel protein [bacterium]